MDKPHYTFDGFHEPEMGWTSNGEPTLVLDPEQLDKWRQNLPNPVADRYFGSAAVPEIRRSPDTLPDVVASGLDRRGRQLDERSTLSKRRLAATVVAGLALAAAGGWAGYEHGQGKLVPAIEQTADKVGDGISSVAGKLRRIL